MRHVNRPVLIALGAIGAAAVALVLAVPASATITPQMPNGSFQTCDLTNWTLSNLATNATGGVTSGGTDGDGCQGYITTGEVDSGLAGTLSHDSFFAMAGQPVTGYAYMTGDCGFDSAAIFIDGHTVFTSNACDSSYRAFSYKVTYTGYHSFEADVFDDGYLPYSTFYLDQVGFGKLIKVS
jgi:hypothetical protein